MRDSGSFFLGEGKREDGTNERETGSKIDEAEL